MTSDLVDVRAVRRHFVFPRRGRIVTNNAASTQPPRELLTLYRRLNLQPPGELTLPISTGNGSPEHGGVMRRATGG